MELPDFYNITMERSHDDREGYDVIYLEGTHKGNFTSRLSHSCDPNCAMVPIAHGGRSFIAMYTIKPINFGEELTWDYSSVTGTRSYQSKLGVQSMQ